MQSVTTKVKQKVAKGEMDSMQYVTIPLMPTNNGNQNIGKHVNERKI